MLQCHRSMLGDFVAEIVLLLDNCCRDCCFVAAKDHSGDEQILNRAKIRKAQMKINQDLHFLEVSFQAYLDAIKKRIDEKKNQY